MDPATVVMLIALTPAIAAIAMLLIALIPTKEAKRCQPKTNKPNAPH